MLDFGKNKTEKKEDIKDVLNALTTTIEAINQKLLKVGGAGGGTDTSAYWSKITASIQYMYDVLKKIYQRQSETKVSLTDFKNEINKNLTDNIQSLMTDIRRLMQTMEVSGGGGAPAFIKEEFTPKYILELKKKLDKLILIHTEEAELFRQQNKLMQNKLERIEEKLKNLK